MGDPSDPAGDEAADLQFDQAEYQDPAAAAPTCGSCKQPIADAYYAINGTVFCDRCRQLIQAHLAGGSGLRRFLRAALFGAGAAVGGAFLYFAVWRVKVLPIGGLILILTGFMVGAAVRSGAQRRGGWVYQALSMALTYLAIDASYWIVVRQVAEVPVLPLEFALTLPIRFGFQNPIGLLIVAFALYEAWKINRRVPLVITGPHPLGDRPALQGVPGHA